MALQQEIERAAEMLAASQHAVVLTGAGHSTPSGIPDFRSPGSGLWEQVDPMEVASIYGFERNPRAFYDWIRPLAKQMMEAQPNPAHYALAELEEMGVLKAIITQNIDELHHRAGSKRVIELHGSVRTATCTRCREHLPTGEMWPAFVASAQLPHCPHCGGLLKPDVVLFGELLPVHVLEEAQPNPAHYALAELEEMGVLKAVITQNIDELHHRAGSKRVLELHGSVRTATCTRCLEHLPTGEMWPAFVASAQVPHCPHCGGLLKPDVVLFGELLPVHVLEEAQQESERCDVMLVAGSSLEVYPAADLPLRAVQAGAQAIIVNYEPTYMDARAAVVIHEDVAVILPQIAAQVKRLKGERLTASL